MDKNIKDIEKALLEDERISRFLQGLMDANEETTFLDELKSDIKLRQRATIQARLIKGMKQADKEIINAFKKANEMDVNQFILDTKINNCACDKVAMFDDEDSDMGESVKLPSKFNVYKFIAAASVILIFFVGYKSYDYYNTTNLGKEYANTFPMTSIIRGEATESVEIELTALFENVVNDKDLDQTITRLLVLWQTAKQDTYNEYTDYAPYIGWYLAIAYLEDYEKNKAKDILTEMEEMYPVGTAMGDKVREILEK